MDFSKLKASRGKNLQDLTKKLEEANASTGFVQDERLYKPGFDKTEGRGYARVRLLPNQHGDSYVRVYSHNFKGKKGYYNETSRKTIGEKDPVGLANASLWAHSEATGQPELQNICKQRKLTTTFYMNVLVIEDEVNPENNGKVKILKCGKQIFKVIENAIKPEFKDEVPIDPFDMWEGADFIMKLTGNEMPDGKGKMITVPNYEKSIFAAKSELYADDDSKKEAIFKEAFDLTTFVAVKEFDALAERFKSATGEAYDRLTSGATVDDAVNELESKVQVKETEKAVVTDTKDETPDFDAETSVDDDDDVLAQFQNLVNK